MRNNHKSIAVVLIMLIICTLTLGYAAFGSELSISNIVADVRIDKDVRVTGVKFISANNGSTSNLNYDHDSVVGNVNLTSYNSTVTLEVSVTNFGNIEMGIYAITGLSDNLLKIVDNYEMGSKLCDSNGKCSLGSTTKFNITIGYDTYDAVTKDHELRLDFEFRKMHQITYTGITNNNYPTSVIDGGNLTFTATSNIPPKIVAFYSNNDRVNYSDYSYVNNVFTYNNITSDVNLKYTYKAYLQTLMSDTDFKESTYKTVIDSIQFVDYVDTSSAVKVYDLSETSGSQDVIGWITSGNDLYIGSEFNIYSKNLADSFNGMSGVKTISFKNLNTSEATSMYYMFYECSGLTSLDLSSFDTRNVTSMGRMFCGVKNVTSLDLSNFNTNNVSEMYAIFDGMSSLTSLDISNFNTSRVYSMNSMFAGVSSLTTLDLSHFNTSGSSAMASMFSGMKSLVSLDISNFDTSKVTTMAQMFFNCNSLIEVDVSMFNTSKVTNMYYMFNGCNNLISLDVSNFDTRNVTDMGRMFQGLGKVTNLDVSNFDTSNVIQMQGMFSGMESLTSLDLSNFKTMNVTKMFEMFHSLKTIETLDLKNFDTSKVTAMYSMFTGCISLNSLDISNFDTSSVTNMNSMFNGDYNLRTLKFDNATFDKITSYTYMFEAVPKSISITTKNATTKAWLENALGDGVGTVTIVS